jgi:hypothetical protein
MNPKRFAVKYFIENPEAPRLAEFIPVFHRWIQNHAVEGLLIDVANYAHVHNGPGVMLIGHEGDYALDANNGRLGLRYDRKRNMTGNLTDDLRATFRLALSAAHALQTDSAFEGKIAFRTGEIELTFLDRLNAPNLPETFQTLKAETLRALDELYPNADVAVESIHADPRQTLAMRITVSSAPTLESLVQ